MKVMVVDDDIRICNAIQRVVEKVGFLTHVITDSEEFDTAFKSHNPDVLLLDVNMPQKDGVQLLKAIPEDSNVMIYLMSGLEKKVLNSITRLSDQLGKGIHGVFRKPLDFKSVIDTLLDIDTKTTEIPVINTDFNQENNKTNIFPISKFDIASAMSGNQLQLNYQPKIELLSGRVVGVEALARWVHPVYGNIPPAIFIPFAEKNGIIKELTLYLLKFALSDYRILKKRFGDIKLSFNISSCLLDEADLPELIENILLERRLRPHEIVLEMTETATYGDPAIAMEVLSRFRIKGFHLSIDDFGTGYSTLNQLLDFPFSELKVDRSFVLAMKSLSNSESKMILESTLELAKKFGIRTVAEGIEDTETYKWLASHGCVEGQGFYICKPQSLLNLLSWFNDYKEITLSDLDNDEIETDLTKSA